MPYASPPSTCMATAGVPNPNTDCHGTAHCDPTVPLPNTATAQPPPCFEAIPTIREPLVEVILRPDLSAIPTAPVLVRYQVDDPFCSINPVVNTDRVTCETAGGQWGAATTPTLALSVKNDYESRPRSQDFGLGTAGHPDAFQGPPAHAWPNRIRVCIPNKSYPAACSDTTRPDQATCEGADEIWFPAGCMDVLPRHGGHKLTWMQGGSRVDLTAADSLLLAHLSAADLAVRGDCARSPNQYIDGNGKITTAEILGLPIWDEPVATTAHCTSYDMAHSDQATCETYGKKWIAAGEPLALHHACAPEPVSVMYPQPACGLGPVRNLGAVRNLQLI